MSTVATDVDTLPSRYTGFQPSSVTLRIACAAPFGVAHVMKMSAPKSFSATIWESMVGSETS